ncbi:MAG: hypothetical protein LBP60_04375 [Spirochaetaceae bacterium]|nr:hypothetical protein [Spirochaetaceae bacterium]
MLVLLYPGFSLFARGKQEESKPTPVNGEFVLCVTAFDVSGLPPSQETLGFILQRELVRDLAVIPYRLRSEEELFRYQGLAWTAVMHDAASRLAEKRLERDALLYQGLPNWKYKKELKRINGELRPLEEDFAKAESQRPLIEAKPLFTISAVNIGNGLRSPEEEDYPAPGAFPPPPERGDEEAFLRTHNADAVLTGTLRFFYGRIYAEFRIFSRGGSFVYEDSTIFSPEDFNGASDELKDRFLTALSNTDPARLVIHTEPEQARILVNERAVKSGEELRLFPGPVSVSVNADDYYPELRDAELTGGEEAEHSFTLRPKIMEVLGLTLTGPGASVYLGALYLGGGKTQENEDTAEAAGGETPETETAIPENAIPAVEATAAERGEPEVFILSIPAGEYRYIRVDTEDGLTGEVIVRGSPEELERRFLPPELSAGDAEIRTITLTPRRLPGPDDKPVELKRQKFYGAYGRFWVTLPLAFIINGVSQSYINSYNTSRSQELYGKARTSYYVSIGAWVVAGAFLVESLIRLGFYIHTANEETIPLWE